MIWATVAPGLIFCWLYTASPSSAAKNRSDFGIDHLVKSMCRVISCVVGKGCLLWPVCLLTKLLAFALLHFALQGQTFPLCHLLIFYFNVPIPYDEKDILFFGVCSRRSCRSSQNHSTSALLVGAQAHERNPRVCCVLMTGSWAIPLSEISSGMGQWLNIIQPTKCEKSAGKHLKHVPNT